MTWVCVRFFMLKKLLDFVDVLFFDLLSQGFLRISFCRLLAVGLVIFMLLERRFVLGDSVS